MGFSPWPFKANSKCSTTLCATQFSLPTLIDARLAWSGSLIGYNPFQNSHHRVSTLVIDLVDPCQCPWPGAPNYCNNFPPLSFSFSDWDILSSLNQFLWFPLCKSLSFGLQSPSGMQWSSLADCLSAIQASKMSLNSLLSSSCTLRVEKTAMALSTSNSSLAIFTRSTHGSSGHATGCGTTMPRSNDWLRCNGWGSPPFH